MSRRCDVLRFVSPCLASGIAMLLCGLLVASVVSADPGQPPMGSFDPFDALRNEAGNPESTLNTNKLEPPGGEEYITAVVNSLEALLDDELEFCQDAGILSPRGRRGMPGGTAGGIPDLIRTMLLDEAVTKGCKQKGKDGSRAGKADRVAKRWRKDAEKIAELSKEAPTDELKKLISSGYDEVKFGPIDATGLYRVNQNQERQGALLKLAEDGFLVPVEGTVEDINQVEDWRLTARTSKHFGQEIPTGQGTKKLIENIVQETYLIGADHSFDGVSENADKREFEGYFLHSLQVLTDDDLTSTVMLVKAADLDPPVERARELLDDYVRIRDFRLSQMSKRQLQYLEAETSAAELFEQMPGVVESSADPASRLEKLQELFGAPIGTRTRTKDSKLIEWSGPIVGLDEELQATLRLDTELDGQPMHTAIFDVVGTPLWESILVGKLKLGEKVSLVAKVGKLDYAAAETGDLLFTLKPALAEARVDPSDAASRETSKSDGKKNNQRSTRRKGVVR